MAAVCADMDLVPFRPRKRPQDVTAYIGMVIFLGGWAMMFAGLFFAYALIRSKAPSWPPPGEVALPVGRGALSTVILLASSGALELGLRAVRMARPRALRPWLMLALLLGIVFCGLQLVMWQKLRMAGLHLDESAYASVFYGLTGLHVLHVAVGLIGLLALVPRALKAGFSVQNHSPLRLWTLYWHFVDAVWVLMFVTIYLV